MERAKIRHNELWKTFQVFIEGTIYAELDTREEATEYCEKGGYVWIDETTEERNLVIDRMKKEISDSGIDRDKCLKISKLLSQAAAIINEVEFEITSSTESDLKYKLLVPDLREPTIWTHLSRLERSFFDAYIDRMKKEIEETVHG